MSEIKIQRPGSVDLRSLYLCSPKSQPAIDLTPFLIEFGLYEDIFNNALTGYVVLSDSRNLISSLPILCEEFIYVNYITPTLPEDQRIEKAFRVFSVTDRKVVRDTNTQVYTLNFCSLELMHDSFSRVYDKFENEYLSASAGQIFSEYISTNSKIALDENSNWRWTEEKSKLILSGITLNGGKFISPGWSPFKLMNWIASKSIPKLDQACNFLFFESNKGYNFIHVEHLLKLGFSNPIGPYYYYPSGIPNKDVTDLMFRVNAMEVVFANDTMKNTNLGYYANQLVEIDLYNKKVEYIAYDHIGSFLDYFHTNGNESIRPFFYDDITKREPLSYMRVYPKNEKLFQKPDSKFPPNINEKMGEVFGNRHSNLQDLTNLKLVLEIPGRTDMKIGDVILFKIPMISTRSVEDSSKGHLDPLYNGRYLVTAIRHKIRAGEHMMTIEVISDSLSTLQEDQVL